MVVIINGAFGVGKTTVSELILAAIPNSMVFDPEEVGTMLRKITQPVLLPQEDTGDFQDIGLWPTLSARVAQDLIRHYHHRLIVPMTLANASYLHCIWDGIRRVDASVYHFCLTASRATIHRRLAQRGDKEGSWPFLQTDRCLESLQSPEFAVHIDTEQRTAEEVAREIIERVGGELDGPAPEQIDSGATY